MDLHQSLSYDDLSSPTVSLEAVLATIAIAAAERRCLVTVDITGAYLEVVLPADHEVFMIIDPVTSEILCQMDDAVTPFVVKNGTVTVKLIRALYGYVQFARL